VRRIAPAILALAAVPLLAFGPARTAAPSHWAVLIGISDYINYTDEEGGDLPGAENDARGMRDVLVSKYNIPTDNILLLLNHDATRAGIESALTEWLPARVQPGDQVTVFYAGHGSQMWDVSGDEDDGLDETLAPADVIPTSTEFDISDDEFGGWLNALNTDNIVVYLDNCSSGTGTRDVTPFSRSRQLGRTMDQVDKPATVARRALPGQTDDTGFDSEGEKILEISAAQPNQAAVDAFFPGEEGEEPFNGGAFTTFLVRELWKAPPTMTYEDVYRRVADALQRNRFEQDPYLSEDVATKDRPLFFLDGGGTTVSEASLPILGVDGSTAELGGGQALGITRGSVFATDDGATLTVVRVQQSRAFAEVSGGSVATGDAVQMTGYRFPATTLKVSVAGIDSETAGAVTGAIVGVPGLMAVSGEQDFADLLLRRRGNNIRIVGMDGALRHAFGSGARNADDIVQALKREASSKRLGDMENPAQEFNLQVELAGGASSFGIGESVQFNAQSERDGYLTLVDLGTDGTVTVLFPNPFDRDNRVSAGQRITFPTESMESEIQAMPPAGRGMVRAFLTPLPLDIPVGEDFTFGETLLADQIAKAVMQAAGLVEGSDEAVKLDSWGSASVVYEIRR
jgi:Domain of unknown function (DUF4384)/Caspase domain